MDQNQAFTWIISDMPDSIRTDVMSKDTNHHKLS